MSLLALWTTMIGIGFTAIWQVILEHVVPLSALGIVIIAILVVVLVPGGLGLVRTALGVVAKFLLGTAAGRAILLGLACLIAGWETRALLDRSVALRQELQAQIKATEAEQATAAAAVAAAAEQRRQAVALQDLGAAATKRAEDAEQQGQDLQDQVDDYADQIQNAAAATQKQACRQVHGLTAADVAALARIGAAPIKPR